LEFLAEELAKCSFTVFVRERLNARMGKLLCFRTVSAALIVIDS
jgi:hypothetical protein